MPVNAASVHADDLGPDDLGPDDLGEEAKLLPGEVARPRPLSVRSTRVAEAVAAARRILEEEGPDALTMRLLAHELGIKAPSLYKHFSGKAALELALIEDGLVAIGETTHEALRTERADGPLINLLAAYRAYARAHPNLYRLGTNGPLRRHELPRGLEDWAGNPFFVVTGDPSLAQALWSFAHGMVTLELAGRYPPGSDLDATWDVGAAVFARGIG